jgi:RNA methyltransferase, TrmH family
MENPIRINSRDNRQLKLARRVRDGKEPGRIFIEGVRLCEEAFRSEIIIENIFFTDESLAFRTQKDVSEIGPSRYLLSEPLLDSIADTKSAQGIVMIGQRPTSLKLDQLFGGDTNEDRIPAWLFLYRTNNPANLGAVIRTAEAAGIRGVIVSSGSADPFSARSLRGSMGSAFRVPIICGAELTDCISTSKKYGVVSAAIDVSGSKTYLDRDWKKPTLLIFGSEAEGLPNEIVPSTDESLKIEMNAAVESLNLAVSCGIILFEARRQNV